jgi:hypothetical protein
MKDGKLSLVMKGFDGDGLYYEPFQRGKGKMVWDRGDYEKLRLEYE